MNLDDIWKKVQNDDDRTAFEVLYYRLFAGMCQYASQIIGDRHLAEEAVQDVFLKVWEKRKSIFSKDGSIKSYFFRLTHNQCLDIHRKKRTQKEALVQLLSTEEWMNITENYGFDDFLIERLEAKDTAVKIQVILNRLPEKCREIFVKSRFENKSNEEIAAEMNISENTVKTQIYRALQKIKEHF